MAGKTSPRRDLGPMLAASLKRFKPPPSLLNKNCKWKQNSMERRKILYFHLPQKCRTLNISLEKRI